MRWLIGGSARLEAGRPSADRVAAGEDASSLPQSHGWGRGAEVDVRPLAAQPYRLDEATVTEQLFSGR
jgi:hypothetical protein